MLCHHIIRQSLGMGKEGQGRRRIIAHSGGALTLHAWCVGRPSAQGIYKLRMRGMGGKGACLFAEFCQGRIRTMYHLFSLHTL